MVLCKEQEGDVDISLLEMLTGRPYVDMSLWEMFTGRPLPSLLPLDTMIPRLSNPTLTWALQPSRWRDPLGTLILSRRDPPKIECFHDTTRPHYKREQH